LQRKEKESVSARQKGSFFVCGGGVVKKGRPAWDPQKGGKRRRRRENI